MCQGDELTVHVKPVEGQSHRLDQAGFFEFLDVFLKNPYLVSLPNPLKMNDFASLRVE